MKIRNLKRLGIALSQLLVRRICVPVGRAQLRTA
jgi:hypothetical protein